MSEYHESINDPPTHPLGKTTYVYAFALLYILFALDFAARLGVVAVFPLLQKELSLTGAQLGLVSSIVLLGMSTFVLPFSFLADKTSKKSAVVVMAAIWGAGTMLCGFSAQFWGILSGRFLTGIGNAAYAPVSVSMLTSWTPRARWGTTVGIYNSAMAVGLAVGTSGASFLAARYGWRMSCLAFGLLSLVFGALAMTLPRSGKGPVTKHNVRLKEGFSVTLQNKTLLLLGLGVGLMNMTFSSMIAWLPVYCVQTLHWTVPQVGAWLGPLYLIKGVLVTPFGGFLADRLGKWDERTRSWFGFPTSMIGAGCALLGLVLESFPLIALGSCFSVLPITGVHIATQELVPARYRASAYGTYVTLLQGLGFLGPIIAGVLSDVFNIDTALKIIQLCIVAGGLCMLAGGFTYRKDRAKARALEIS